VLPGRHELEASPAGLRPANTDLGNARSMSQRATPSMHVGVVHREQVSGYFFISFSRFHFHDAAHEGFVIRNGGWDSVMSGPRLSEARNTLVRHFLQATDHVSLWMLDADMTFEPNTLARLVEVADPQHRLIVGDLCFGRSPSGEVVSTMITFDESGD